MYIELDSKKIEGKGNSKHVPHPNKLLEPILHYDLVLQTTNPRLISHISKLNPLLLMKSHRRYWHRSHKVLLLSREEEPNKTLQLITIKNTSST